MHIGETLKQARIRKGLTQRQAAALLGLDCQNRLSRWEREIAVPTIKNLQLLSKVYKTDFSDIFGK